MGPGRLNGQSYHQSIGSREAKRAELSTVLREERGSTGRVIHGPKGRREDYAQSCPVLPREEGGTSAQSCPVLPKKERDL